MMLNHANPFVAQSHGRRSALRTVLREVVRSGAISRAELSRRTGLSKQTISDIMRELLEGDWVREVGQQRGHVGRSATNFELNGQRAYVWGGDLGGTKLRIAIADLSGEVLVERTEPASPEGGMTIARQICDLVRTSARDGGLPFNLISCGALGVPGSYDRRSGRLRLVSNIAGLEDLSLEALLSEQLGMRVFVENDVTLAAKGELHAGNPRKTGSFVFLAMGTGVGLGLVSDGGIVRGASGAAGEIAWLPIAGDPFDSRNFRAGTLENAISSHAMLDRYRAAGGPSGVTIPGLFERMEAGDPAARNVLRETARSLALAIVAIRAILDPEAVVFGGSIGARPELIALVREALKACMPELLPLEISRLGDRAGQTGAIAKAIDHFHETMFADAPVDDANGSPGRTLDGMPS